MTAWKYKRNSGANPVQFQSISTAPHIQESSSWPQIQTPIGHPNWIDEVDYQQFLPHFRIDQRHVKSSRFLHHGKMEEKKIHAGASNNKKKKKEKKRKEKGNKNG